VFFEEVTPKGPKRRSRWMPLFEAPPDFMQVSFQLRRRQGRADMIQLDLDWESYRDNNIHGAALPPINADFTQDILDSKQPTTYQDEPSDSDGDDDDKA
jgi:hypothetical protein